MVAYHNLGIEMEHLKRVIANILNIYIYRTSKLIGSIIVHMI